VHYQSADPVTDPSHHNYYHQNNPVIKTSLITDKNELGKQTKIKLVTSDMGPIQFQNWNWLFKKNGIGIDELELKFTTKNKLNPQIDLPFIYF